MFDIITKIVSLTKMAKKNMEDMEILLDVYSERIEQLDAEIIALRHEIKRLNQLLSGKYE